ncbi:MAG: amidohydrolase family protein [Gammaproteobacteria bacterium]|nr:amidohydrolase family protein [Gammaproteobacteria bacterium]
MKHFDFNIHIPCGDSELESRWKDETSMTGKEFEKCYKNYITDLEELCFGGNFMILNHKLNADELGSLVETIKSSSLRSCVTVMIDHRDPGWKQRLSDLYAAGVSAIKFHCYIQKITDQEISECVEISKNAQSLGMMVMIDTSYGSFDMYQYDNLKLASAVAKQVAEVPIILLHSGGARCIEAMLLADCSQNIYLETSFSLPYYIGSSVERDLAFVYKKLGSERIVYGSDFPYINQKESINTFLDFARKWDFSDTEINNILTKSASRVLEIGA